jgi:hypothetical protein
MELVEQESVLHWRVFISVTPDGSGSDFKEPVTRRRKVGLLFLFSRYVLADASFVLPKDRGVGPRPSEV